MRNASRLRLPSPASPITPPQLPHSLYSHPVRQDNYPVESKEKGESRQQQKERDRVNMKMNVLKQAQKS